MLRQGILSANARIQDPQLDSARQRQRLARRRALDRAAARGGAALARAASGTAVGRRQPARDQRHKLARDLDFRSARDFNLAAGHMTVSALSSQIEGDPFADLVGGDHVELLALELAARVSSTSLVSAAKPTTKGAWPYRRPT